MPANIQTLWGGSIPWTYIAESFGIGLSVRIQGDLKGEEYSPRQFGGHEVRVHTERNSEMALPDQTTSNLHYATRLPR
jgi:hypothetical protein